LAAVPAQAAIVGQDTFESYAAGSQLNGQNGGSNFTGPYVVDSALLTNVTTVSQTLAYSNGTVANGGGSIAVQVLDAANSNNLISRPFASQSGTIYFSFLLRAGTGSLTNEDFLQLGLSDAATAEPKASVGIAGTTAGSLPEQFFARVPNAGTSVFSGSSATVAEYTTYMLVGKVSKAGGSTTYNQVDLYLNPSSGIEPAVATATSTATAGSGASTVSNFIFRAAREDPGDQFFVDNLRIGTTYADVVPVPEPAGAGLILVAGGLLCRRRRIHV
jgi:hypothetical protein